MTTQTQLSAERWNKWSTVATAGVAILALAWSVSNTFYSCSLDQRTQVLQEQGAILNAELSRPMLVVEQFQIDPPKDPVSLKSVVFPLRDNSATMDSLLQHVRKGGSFPELTTMVVKNYGVLPAKLDNSRYVIVSGSAATDTSIFGVRVSHPARLVIGPGQSETLTGQGIVFQSILDSVLLAVVCAKLHECEVITFLEYTAHQSSILKQQFADTTAFTWNGSWQRSTIMTYDRIIQKLRAKGM